LAAENRSVNQLYRANTEIPEEVNLGIDSTAPPSSQILQKYGFVPFRDNLVSMQATGNDCNHCAIV